MLALLPTDGSDPLVKVGEAPEPPTAPDEALIRVEAFSVNRGETFLLEHPRDGWRPGRDVSGRVICAAVNGSGPAAGQRVVGHPPAAGWAQLAAVPSDALAVLPDQVDVVEAAALPLAGLTALRLLRASGAVAGLRVLLTGASGGVGHYVTELASAAGAAVTAVTASPERAERLLALGAVDVVHSVDDAIGPYDGRVRIGRWQLAVANAQAAREGRPHDLARTSEPDAESARLLRVLRSDRRDDSPFRPRRFSGPGFA